MDQKNHAPNKPPQDGDKRPKNNMWITLLITVCIVLLITGIYNMISDGQYQETTYDQFRDYMLSGDLEEVELQSNRIIYLTREEASKPAAQQQAYYIGLPLGDHLALAEELAANGVKVYELYQEDNSAIMLILYYVLMFGVIFLFMRMLTKRMSGDGMMGSFGKSKAKVYMEKQTGVTFKDVAGQDEAKESLQ